ETGRELIRLAQQFKPDIAVVDISMPELNGLDALPQLKSSAPDTAVIMLTMHVNEQYVMQALKAGASGYMLKTAAANELESAIRAVSMGNSYLSPAVSKSVIDSCLGRNNLQPRTRQLLTPRQREILQLIAEGKTSKQIANKLCLSFKTVETHRAQLMERLDIHDVAGLVRCAMRLGLISADR
ncbi:MAG: response regulator transcription factor, partial [Gammaproteobacteria bacterium]